MALGLHGILAGEKSDIFGKMNSCKLCEMVLKMIMKVGEQMPDGDAGGDADVEGMFCPELGNL